MGNRGGFCNLISIGKAHHTRLAQAFPERAEQLFAESEAAAKAVERKASPARPTNSLFRSFRRAVAWSTPVLLRNITTKSIKKSKSVSRTFNAFPSPYERLKKLVEFGGV